MTTSWRVGPAAVPLALLLTACGGAQAGGGGSGGHPTPGIALPSEISAVPAREGASASARAAALPGGDFAAASTVRYVDERALAQFDILNVIFGAVAQTHYADPANVNQGPYAAVVSWVDGNGDREEKTLVRWVVDSRMVSMGGQEVNRVKVWFFQPKDGQQRVIQVALDVFQAPTRAADGTTSDYGVWTLNAKLSDDGRQYFAASADHLGGLSRVMIHETEDQGGETRGILLRSDGAGSGKVVYPDWSDCQSQSCAPTPTTVAYVYDAGSVALRKGGHTSFKSRLSTVDVAQRYGLYDAATGADVTRTHTFGFPIRWGPAGQEQYGYYGAWQGRHQVWANGAAVAPGLTVHRGDRDGATQAYQTSSVFPGVLARRSYEPSSAAELVDLVLNTWEGRSAQVTFDGALWTACFDPTWSGGPQPSCASSGQVDPAQLFRAPSPEQVQLNFWSQGSQASVNLVFDGAHFWVATPGNPPQQTGSEWTPHAGDVLWVNRSGPIWVTFDGTSWWKKHVVAYDQSRNQPTFGGSDTAFAFPLDRDQTVNASGVNYVLRQTAGGLQVKIERQTVPNPVDAALLIPAGLRFRRSWGGDTGSTFRFGSDPGQPGFLELAYDAVGPQDAAAGRTQGQPVTEGIWMLGAELDGVVTPDTYSWEYSSDGQGYAVQQYLLQGGSYLVLDDPIRLRPISLVSHAGQARSYALQFDGSWVGGLPDVQDQLRNAGFDMTAALADQVVNVPSGQEVTDALDPARHYLFKPLQVSQYLLPVADPGTLDLSAAVGLDLAQVPAFADAGMGAAPDVPVRYSEGVLVE